MRQNLVDIYAINNKIPNISNICAKCNNFTHKISPSIWLYCVCKKCEEIYCRHCISSSGKCIDCIHKLSIEYCNVCNFNIDQYLCYLCDKIIKKCQAKCLNYMISGSYSGDDNMWYPICFECFQKFD